MKINYKNTALGLIDDPGNFNFGFPDPDITPSLSPEELRKFGFSLIASSDGLRELCGNNIQYVSHSTVDYIEFIVWRRMESGSPLMWEKLSITGEEFEETADRIEAVLDYVIENGIMPDIYNFYLSSDDEEGC